MRRFISTLLFLSFFHLSTGHTCDLQLTILHTNDHHGHTWGLEVDGKMMGGFAKRATLIKQIRADTKKKGQAMLLLDAGDFNTGTFCSDHFDAKPDLEMMSLLRYDALTLGNHEFDKPLETLKKQKKWAAFPFISLNVLDAKRKKPLFDGYFFKKIDCIRIYVIGLTTETTPEISMFGGDSRILFEDTARSLGALLKTLTDEDAFIIVLSHLGVDADRALAKAFPRIHLIVGGHSHTGIKTPIMVGHTRIVQANPKGAYMGKVVVTFHDGKPTDYRYTLLKIGPDIPEDPLVQKRLDPYRKKCGQKEMVVVGTATDDFTRKGIRGDGSSSTMSNLVNNAVLEITQADIAFVNRGGIRADIPKGPIRFGDIYRSLPFANTVWLYTLKGQEIMKLLEEIAQRRAYGPGLLLPSGITFSIQKDEPVNVLIKGRPLDMNGTYTVAVSSYIAQGGDNYRFFKSLTGKMDTGLLYHVILETYIRKHQTITPVDEVRLQFIDEN